MVASDRDEELVDHLDRTGSVIGAVTRAEMRSGNLLHRSVFVVVRNGADEVLVHRRASWKDLWPDHWDIAVSGVVAAGESWELAASRELAEELGTSGELAYLGEGTFEDDEVRELARIYQVRSEGPFDFTDEEIVEVAWVPIGELAVWLDGHEVCPDSRALVPPRLDAP